MTAELEGRRGVPGDDLEPVSLRYVEVLGHGLLDRVRDQAQILAGTAFEQVDVD